MSDSDFTDYPSLSAIAEARAQLGERIIETPVLPWQSREIREAVAPGTEVILKLELFQHTGTFKARGALINVMRLNREALARGVTAVSAGNHAIATAFAARAMGSTAKVVMLSTASAVRREKCLAFGAEVVLCDEVHRAFDLAREIAEEEGRSLIHPFEGEGVALGTGTAGLEFARQAPDLDAVIIPVGGGGLCGGISCAMKQALPGIEVYGVEPEGADSMSRSFKSGKTEKIDQVRTIADSLGAPHTEPYSMALCRNFVDDLVLISDDQMIAAMRRLFYGAKLAVEPAGAAATAALIGPLKERLAGKKVGIVVCGSNISTADFCRLISE
jgi:threonine dehydratase